MPADIHDTVPCTKRPPLSQHNVSSEILYGAERSLTILIFSSFGRTLYLKFDRSRVLSRALLSRKYPIFEREGRRGKKKKGKKSQWNDGQFSTRNSFLLSSALSLFFCLVHLLGNDRSFFLSSQNGRAKLPAKIRRKRGLFFSPIDRDNPRHSSQLVNNIAKYSNLEFEPVIRLKKTRNVQIIKKIIYKFIYLARTYPILSRWTNDRTVIGGATTTVR